MHNQRWQVHLGWMPGIGTQDRIMWSWHCEGSGLDECIKLVAKTVPGALTDAAPRGRAGGFVWRAFAARAGASNPHPPLLTSGCRLPHTPLI